MPQETSIACIIVDDEIVAREIIEAHLSTIPRITLVGSFNNAMDALKCLREHTVDLVFLDINMPDISGISFAKSITGDVKVIFTTAYREYAVEGFELQAVDYLLKPISYERILKAVNVYHENYVEGNQKVLTTTPEHDFMFVRADRKMIKIDFDVIIYMESYGDYLKIHTAEETIVTRETLNAIEAKLPADKFLRIHRSFIIALQHIASFTHEEIIVANKALTISRSYKKEVLEVLEKF